MPASFATRRIQLDPRWRPAREYTGARPPADLRAWLLDDGSLTARLIALNRGPFRVQRRQQSWQRPLLSESRLLQVPPRQLALVREVDLIVGDRTAVFARSVFPVASLDGALRHLRYLHNASLGSILFRYPGMRRSPFELAALAGDSDYLPRDLHRDGPLWGRRSKFVIAGHGLIVSEIFLQDMPPLPAAPRHSGPGKVNAAIAPPTQ